MGAPRHTLGLTILSRHECLPVEVTAMARNVVSLLGSNAYRGSARGVDLLFCRLRRLTGRQLRGLWDCCEAMRQAPDVAERAGAL